MDVALHMLDSAGQAFIILMDPYRLMFLTIGCVLGLIFGILPGIGGLSGTAMLLPFTFAMDPYTAFAFLLGLGSTTATGDPIPAIMFGVPGGAGSAATVLDGLPMAKRGEAGRALSAAYMSSLMGGVFGAFVMAISIPILRPLMLSFGSPEMLALSVFGISMVAILSGRTPLRGLTAAGLGIMLAMVGSDPQTGTLRWTMDNLYLWEGVKLLPLVLGMFALPELCDLAIARTAISGDIKYGIKGGMWQGAADCFKHWWLIIRCSTLGAVIGAVPGMGASIIDWLAYGHALRTEKGANLTFGKGDVRGVIASEASNNAKEGGALVPTVAFGIPGSAGMSILLGAFLIHGLVPGPDMLSKNLTFTYSMVWSVALANIVGAGICYLFSEQFAKLSTLRYTLIMPSVLSIIYVGAFEGSRNWGDLYSLLLFGVLGWCMKQAKWPRPPFILGFVLGDIIERYLFISVERYGWEWLSRPVVAVLFALALLSLIKPVWEDYNRKGGASGLLRGFGAPKLHLADLVTVFFICALSFMLWQAAGWNLKARIVPQIVGGLSLTFATMALLYAVFQRSVKEEAAAAAATAVAAGGEAAPAQQETLHMDLESDTDHIPRDVLVMRACIFFGWMLAFMASMATIGIVITVPLFVIAFMRFENNEPWKLVLPQAIILGFFVYAVFDQLMSIPWPPTVLGDFFPQLKGIIPSI